MFILTIATVSLVKVTFALNVIVEFSEQIGHCILAGSNECKNVEVSFQVKFRFVNDSLVY